MANKILDNGTLLTLGLVGVVAAVGAASKAGLYGSRAHMVEMTYEWEINGDEAELSLLRRHVRSFDAAEAIHAQTSPKTTTLTVYLSPGKTTPEVISYLHDMGLKSAGSDGPYKMFRLTFAGKGVPPVRSVGDGIARIESAIKVLLAASEAAAPAPTPPKGESGLQPTGEVVLYHGTYQDFVPSILKSGLTAAAGWGGANTHGVFLSGTVEGGRSWGRYAAATEMGMSGDAERYTQQYPDLPHVRVFRVVIPANKVKNLRADMEQAEEYDYGGKSTDWQASLLIIGDVMYKGEIPASWVSLLGEDRRPTGASHG